ncbi:MAG: UMP kinase [Candidatus Moranbacteria bacterium]|nr:UMP kinase [Candidatus Moranbacteria bacterium]
MDKKIALIKFGGSVMTPNLPDKDYIKKFIDFIERLREQYRLILVAGGGGINKKYNKLAKQINPKISNKNLDWIGIYATRLNARTLISVFGDQCYPRVISNPIQKIEWKQDLLVGAGWKPGWSTDYCSLLLADNLKADKIIIATNTDYVFDKDPNEFLDAKPLEKISWDDLRSMVGDEWTPRMHIPLDPSAIRFGQKNKYQVISLNGRNLENMEKAILGKDFIGTVIGT